MAHRIATERDWSYILGLSKKHAEELGFIPAAAMQNYLQRGRVSLATENGDPAGYFLTGGLETRQLRIFQACVQIDARGLKHGILLLSDLITRAAASGTHFLSLHCRDGLESNGFWSACGFKNGGLILGGQARKKIVMQWELDIRDAISNPSLPYAGHLLASLRAGTQQSALENACNVVAGTQKGPQKQQESAHYLDTEESNVNAACHSLAQSRSFASEALRTLALANSLT